MPDEKVVEAPAVLKRHFPHGTKHDFMKKIHPVFLLAILMVFFCPVPVMALEGITNEDCLTCHDAIDPVKFKASIHGNKQCTSCHSDIKGIPHEEKLGPVQCAGCHRTENEIYQNSDHGKAVSHGAPAAGCISCHGEPHSLLNYRDPASPVYRLNIPKTCGICHEDQVKMAPYGLSERTPVASYALSVHGKALLEKKLTSAAVCTDCHGSHDLHAPTNPLAKIFWKNVPATCGKCHENVMQTYNRSIHGQGAREGKRESPVCTDCHGEHGIKSHLDPTSSVYSTVISQKTCGNCHSSEKINNKFGLPKDRVSSYFESYHGLASRLGVTTVANCASCHGAHDILPSADPNSSVNKNNLSKTCGECHPGAGAQLAKGKVHGQPLSKGTQIVFYVTIFYILLIIGVIGGMLVHNFLDFSKKFRKHFSEIKAESAYLRFTVVERIQHGVLSLTFMVLAYTGFALRYPDSWWNFPFLLFKSNTDWRGIIHKGTAIVFILLLIYHAGAMILTRRGRMKLVLLFPGVKDVKDCFALLGYNLGLCKKKPQFGQYSYIEKAEYWALIWGSVVMIVTGGILTFADYFMQYLPKWAMDLANTIHFYEAVLAVLAILVWHFYFVIFDPEAYPLNLSMVTGKVPEEEKAIKDPPKKDPPKEKKPA
ncbi:MAG: cytochrome b/b6 domain-containing protein [Candidatus Omnitrophota bacterium]